LTIIALNYWPWKWSLNAKEEDVVDENDLRTNQDQENNDHMGDSQGSEDRDQEEVDEMAKLVCSFRYRLVQSIDRQDRLRRCLLLAALACILRPTNALIWMCVAYFTLLQNTTKGEMLPLPREGAQKWSHITSLSLLPAIKRVRLTLVREVILCG